MPVIKRSLKLTSLKQVRNIFRTIIEAEEKQITDVYALHEEKKANQISRRKFLGDTAKASAIVGLAGLYQSCTTPPKKTQPVIAIIGAGIAGLHAAYILKKAGYTADIYEGSARIGGRIMSAQDIMGPGLWTEMGGEFIDSTHADMLNLVQQFHLPMLDRLAPSEQQLEEFAYFFGGKHYHSQDVIEALKPYAAQIKKDIDSLSDEITYNSFTDADKRLDNMSIMQYLDSLGIKGWLRNFFYNSYTAEYGMEADEQSAISFLGVFDPGNDSHYYIYGDSDERYSVIGGNSKVCEALAAEVEDHIMENYFLKAIKQNADNTYTLTFNITGAGPVSHNADIILMTIPFTVLREVDMQVSIPEWKMNAIKNIGYGTNSKLFVGVKERVWRQQGYAGYAFSDNGMMNGYDHTQMQRDNKGTGGFTIFLGGKAGIDAGNADIIPLKQRYVQALDGVYPGVGAQFNNNFQMWNWPGYGYSKGSYVSFKVGQYTTICGAEFTPVDNLYFAGEHCSYEFQGFMNGGAETGRRAAEAIIKKLSV